MVDEDIINSETDSNHPVLLIPRKCTMLETNCTVADNVFIYLNISSQDIEGNDIDVYTGFCSVKILENCSIDVVVNDKSVDSMSSPKGVIVSDAGSQGTFPDSQIWIDEARSPHICNSYDAIESDARYNGYHQGNANHITVEQHNTYITQNVYNYNEPVQYSMRDYDHEIFGAVDVSEKNQSSTDPSLDEDIDCGTFIAPLSEDIIMENENRAQEELKYVGLQSSNEALNQLMSSDIQSESKQQRSVLYLGKNSHHGQTIHSIAIKDPKVRCREISVDKKIDPEPSDPKKKKYQCDKCKQIFDQINSFKLHIRATHEAATNPPRENKSGLLRYVCYICGKVLKSEKKFQTHILGHGNPELECATCHKVFASKFTLRNHQKLHLRTHRCTHCSRTYYTMKELKAHRSRLHGVKNCNVCEFYTTKYSELSEHYDVHKRETDAVKNDSETTLSLDEDWTSKTDTIPAPVEDFLIRPSYESLDIKDKDMEPDAVIAKVMSNQVFLLHSKKTKRHKNRKICNVCHKTFNRVSDLKRHLIEHVIRSTLAKAPLRNSALSLTCEICHRVTFTKIDKYKAHLREHAKLTLYKCIFCDKSFSDSSNFSKHKKTHGTAYLQCDLCQRKFNTKKTLTRHIEYHNKNTPLSCCFCDKKFYFASMLKKHVKMVHHRVAAGTKCRFCQVFFSTLREKWDHDWLVHNVRKLVVDCHICDSKFRKYAELKRHYRTVHGMKIPPKKHFKRRRRAT